MMPELAICLELRFREPLIGGRLVRKFKMFCRIVQHICGFSTSERTLYVKQRSWGCACIYLVVSNRSNCAMPSTVCRFWIPFHRTNVDIDRHAQIATAFAN